MLGSDIELKWNHKDLESLKAVVEGYVPRKRRRVAVQAGACLGVFPNYLATHFAHVYTFEPDPELFREMVIRVEGLNVYRFQAALGCEHRLVRTVCELRGNDGKTVLHPGMTRTEPDGAIPTMLIDELGLSACDLIYLDIEGDELLALRGARMTILELQPVVVLEINRGIKYRGLSEEDVFTHMRLLGYDHAATFRSDKVFVPRRTS